MTTTASAPRAYALSFRTGRYLLAAGLAALGAVLLSGWTLQTPPPPYSAREALLGLVLIAGGLVLAYHTAVTRLTLSAEGLHYRSLGGQTRASWDQVRALRRRRTRYGFVTVLVLAGQQRPISLSQFGGNWRTSQLGQDLQRYAPRLFKEEQG